MAGFEFSDEEKDGSLGYCESIALIMNSFIACYVLLLCLSSEEEDAPNSALNALQCLLLLCNCLCLQLSRFDARNGLVASWLMQKRTLPAGLVVMGAQMLLGYSTTPISVIAQCAAALSEDDLTRRYVHGKQHTGMDSYFFEGLDKGLSSDHGPHIDRTAAWRH